MTDANGIKLPNNYNLLLKFTPRGYFFSELCKCKTEKLAKKKPRLVGKTKIKFIR